MIATVDGTPHPPPTTARIWFGILGAPAAWAAQCALGWFVAGVGCETGAAGWFSPAVARGIEFGIGAVALVVALAALAIGFGAWRGSGDRGLMALKGSSRADYLAATALLVSFVFAIAIVLTTIPQFILPMCEAAR